MGGKEIIVKQGETFEHIAQKHYGDAHVGDILRRAHYNKPLNEIKSSLETGDVVDLVADDEIFGIAVTPQSIALKDNEALAGKIIADLHGKELQDFARVLLITVKPGSSDKVIKRAIYEKAETEPGEILNEWNDENRELKVILRKGLEKQLFTYRQGRYTFDGQLMGTTFDIAVDWLKANEDFVPSMRKQLK